MDRQRPADFHPALTEERLIVAARLLVKGRSEALARAEPDVGDDAWSIGCRAYSFSRYQVRRASESGRYPWLKVLDETQHFVFLIQGVPIRFYRGPADDPSARTLVQHENEAAQISLAFGEAEEGESLMFRLALETGNDASVRRVVFLAFQGEEAVGCWPIPLDPEPRVLRLPTSRKEKRVGQASQLDLPISSLLERRSN